MNRREVVITGLGAVSSFGVGVEPLATALHRGQPKFSLVDELARLPRTVGAPTLAALVPPVDLRRWLPPLVARRMSPPSRWAVAAARMALEEAGWELPGEPDPSAAVALATSFGPMSFTQRMLDQIFDEGPEAASPFLFTECVANAPAAQVSIQCRAAGRNHTLCQREAGALSALARGAADVATGRAESALAGAAEEVTPLVFAVLDRFGALARPSDAADGDEAARPFDRRRNGLVMADGAGVATLEPASAAERRAAPVLARVRAMGGAFDASAGRAGWGSGVGVLGRELTRFLDRAGVDVGSIDRVVAGASGSREGDRLEARMLRAVWRHRALPPVLAPKGVTGEYGGGFLAAAVLAAAGRPFGPTAGFAEPDPELGLVPHDGSVLPPPRRVLVTTLAAGGAAAWGILDAP